MSEGPTLPAVGATVGIATHGGRPLPTRVAEATPDRVVLELPPVLATGTIVELTWATAARATALAAEVVASDERLAVVPGRLRAIDRRDGGQRRRPPRPLAVSVAVPATAARESGTVRGALHDLSPGGLAFATRDRIPPGLVVEITIGAPMKPPDLRSALARVAAVREDPQGRRVISCAFLEPDRVGRMVGALLAA